MSYVRCICIRCWYVCGGWESEELTKDWDLKVEPGSEAAMGHDCRETV